MLTTSSGIQKQLSVLRYVFVQCFLLLPSGNCFKSFQSDGTRWDFVPDKTFFVLFFECFIRYRLYYPFLLSYYSLHFPNSHLTKALRVWFSTLWPSSAKHFLCAHQTYLTDECHSDSFHAACIWRVYEKAWGWKFVNSAWNTCWSKKIVACPWFVFKLSRHALSNILGFPSFHI